MNRESTDAIVIGGGPAGLAAALALADKGAKCTVVDFKQPPIDKPCGEGLMPDSLKELAQLGVIIPREKGFSFDGIRFLRGNLSVQGDFPEGRGLGVRRTVLHEILVSKAVETTNISLLWNSRVKFLTPTTVAVGDRELVFDWMIGADGLNSSVRRWSGLDSEETVSYRYGFRKHYQIEPWSSHMELYWSDVGQMYVTPVCRDELCVVFLSKDKTMRFEQALPFFPELQERLTNSLSESKVHGAVSATRMLKSAAVGRIALVGDAAGSVDAITGEGMALSFRQSFALADAIASGDLSAYAKAQRSLAQLPTRMAHLMLLLDRYPHLQPRIIKSLSLTPDTFGKLLSAHVGKRSLPMTLLSELPKVAWNLIMRSNHCSDASSHLSLAKLPIQCAPNIAHQEGA